MLQFLKELIQTNPFVEEIDLENKGITSLDSTSVDLLGRFSELRKINLSENYIRKLPNDLSPIAQVVEFNLNGNPIDDLEAAVDSLLTMQSLKSLHINLHEEEQVDYLLRTLINLEFLNGLAVEREALFNDEESQVEEPSQINKNDLSESFQQMSPPEQQNMERHEEDSQNVLVGSESFPVMNNVHEKLQSANKNFQAQESEVRESYSNQLISDLKNFSSNKHQSNEKQEIEDEEIVQTDENSETMGEQEEEEENELKAQDLEAIAILYDQIRSIRRKKEQNVDKKLAEEFDQHLKNIMFELSQKLQEIEGTSDQENQDYMRKKAIVETKKSLIFMCFSKANEYLRYEDPQCFEIYKTIIGYVDKLVEKGTKLEKVKTVEVKVPVPQEQPKQEFNQYKRKSLNESSIQRTLEEHDKNKNGIIEGLQKQLQQKDEEIAHLKQLLQKKDQTIQNLQDENNQNQRETQSLIDQNDNLEKEVQRLQSEKKTVQNENQEQKQYYEIQIQGLEEENKKMLETLIRHSKNKVSHNNTLNGLSHHSLNTTTENPVGPQGNTSTYNNALQPSQAFNTVNYQNQQQNNQKSQFNTMRPQSANASGYHQQAFNQSTNSSQIQPSVNVKIIPLKQLKDIIQDIYQQKIKYDIKCRESKLPIETMEQFMYTYLNQKYGLKSLIIEWASTIINGVRTYLKDDHEITLFGKILKNECDEEFRFIQMHVKETLQNLLKILLREKYHLKSEGEISQMSENIQNGCIEDWQWKKIVQKMYDRDDVCMLTDKFVDAINQRNSSLKENNQHFSQTAGFPSKLSMRKQSRDEEMRKRKQPPKPQTKLLYSEFLKIILDFQLQEHEKFLSKFTQVFKSVDHDNNGIIDENEFRTLIIKMGVVDSHDDIETLLQIIDPNNNQQMTYSEIVQLLSSQMVPISEENMRQIPLLEKFVSYMYLLFQNNIDFRGQVQSEEQELEQEWQYQESQQQINTQHDEQNQQQKHQEEINFGFKRGARTQMMNTDLNHIC